MSDAPIGDSEPDTSAITSVGAFSSLLSNGECRAALRCLCDDDEPCSLEAFEERVTRRLYDAPPEAVSMLDRTRLASNLHYDHLPTLSAYGLIEYDSRNGQLTEISLDDGLREQVTQANW